MSTRRSVLPAARALIRGILVLVLAAAVPAASGSTVAPVSPSLAGALESRSLDGRTLEMATTASLVTALVARPATPDGPVPANLRPALGVAPRDYPRPYFDGCHAQVNGKSSPTATCLYGNLKSTTTIALFGDSHALAWFPAVLRIAEDHGWRLLNLTMSACSPADIRNWVPAWNRVSTECTNWRQKAISRLTRERPAIILVAGTRGFELADSAGNVLTGSARTRAWEVGMQRTLARLKPAAGRIIMIADTPVSLSDPPVCLAQNPASVLACATPVAAAVNQAWLGEEQHAASRAGAAFIDPSLWVCPSSPCPVLVGNVLIFRNAGHLTATFAATLSSSLEQAMGIPAAAVV